MPPPDGETTIDLDAIQAENARLKADLEAARRQVHEEASSRDTLDNQLSQANARVASAQLTQLTAQETAANNTLASLEQEIAGIKRQKSMLMAEGKFDEATELDEKMADAAARRLQANSAKEYYSQQRTQLQQTPTDPVEQFISANRNLYSDEDLAWIRRNPRFAKDPNFNRRVTEAHTEAVEKLKLEQRSPAYYEHLSRRGYMRGDDPQPAQTPQQAPTESAPAPSGYDPSNSLDSDAESVQPQIIIRDQTMPQDTQGDGAFGRAAERPQPRAAGSGSLRAAVAAAPSRRAIGGASDRRTVMEFTQGERDSAMSMAPYMFSEEVLRGGEPAILTEYRRLQESPTAQRIRQGWVDRRG